MAKKSTPYFPFYPDDWHGGTKHLDHVERACYLDLLLYQFANGAIPGEALVRMNLCGISDVGQWERIWRHISDKFEVDEGGLYRNPKMEEIRNTATQAYRRSVESGKAGAAKRWRKDTNGNRPPIGDPNGNQNQNQNQSKNSPHPRKPEFSGDPEGFENEWAQWLNFRIAADGTLNEPQVQTTLMKLCAMPPDKAARDILFSIERGGKRILDSDNDFDKRGKRSTTSRNNGKNLI